jgi:hypothetical protein
MKRPVMLHGVLLAGGLVAAYLTWTRDPTGAEDEVQIVNLRGGLDRAIFKSEDRSVEIVRRKDQQGSYHWLHVETWEVPPPPPPPPASAPAPAPAPDTKADPKKAEPKKAEPKQAEPKQAEPKKAEPKKAEPKKAEPKKKAEAKSSLDKDPKADPKKAEPKKAEPKQAEPKKAEPKKAEPKKAEPKKAEPKKAEPKKAEPKKAEPRPTPTLTPPPPPPPRAKVKKVQEFKGSKSADELMKGLSTLAAVRSLGVVTDAEKLKAFGLEGSKKTLTLVAGSSPRVFVLGGNTYGNMDTYLQDKQDGRVYVVRPRLLQDFLYAEFRLVDRMLHAFDPVDVERATVTAPSGKKELVQQNRRDPAGSYWAEAATPEKKKDFYRNWMTKVMRLSGLEYVAPEKKLEGLKLLVTMEYFGGGKRLGECRLYKLQTLVPKVAGSTETGAGDYYAISENSRAMVKLSRPLGEEIERDIGNLMKE